MAFRIAELTISFLCFFNTLRAQQSISIKRVDSPPKVDGILSFEEWKDVTKTELAYQKEPQENDKSTEKTDVYLALDKAIFSQFRLLTAKRLI